MRLGSSFPAPPSGEEQAAGRQALARIRESADAAGVLMPSVLELVGGLSGDAPVRVLEVARRTGLPRSALKLLVRELGLYIRPEKDGYLLTPAGVELAAELAEYRAQRAQARTERGAEALRLLEQVESRRRRSDRNLDQFRATPQTSVARAQLSDQQYDIDGRQIVLLGDNDLTSVALAMLGEARRITVIDIDEAVLDLLRTISSDEGLPIECIHHDLRSPTPLRMHRRFDVIFTDPPYTPNGIMLFLSRAGELGNRKRTSIYLSYGSSLRARERELRVQGVINELGWLIYDLRPRFNTYFAAGSIGSRSNLYRLLRTPKTKIPIQGHFREDIYTGQSSEDEEKG